MSDHTSMASNTVLRPAGSAKHPLLVAENLSKQYSRPGRLRGNAVHVFHELNFSIERGEMVGVVGQSGSGKSSLLHLLAALDRPTSGDVRFDGQALSQLDGVAAARFRNREVGYVWQFHYLLPEFTAAENIALPLLARGMHRRGALREASGWLERVGLAGRLDHQAGELSGGEQQRVSIARALCGRPQVLLADEPTGDLDEGTSEGIFRLLHQLHRDEGLTTVLVTHNMVLARRCDRVLRLTEGRMQELSPASL